MSIKSIRMKYRQKMAIVNNRSGQVGTVLGFILQRYPNLESAIAHATEMRDHYQRELQSEKDDSWKEFERDQAYSYGEAVQRLEELRTEYWRVWNDGMIPRTARQILSSTSDIDRGLLAMLADMLDDAGYEQSDAQEELRRQSGSDTLHMNTVRLLQYFARG